MMLPAAKRLFALTFTQSRIGHRFNRRLSEWHLAGVMLVIGVVLAVGDTLALPPYEVVRQIAGPGAWSFAMIFIGAARLGALILNGHAARLSSHLRWGLASASAFVWAIMLAGLLAFDTPLMVGPFLGAAAIVDLVTSFRAAQDARQADERERGGEDAGPG